MITGNIFEIKRFAVHDGPGIRTTFFFKGCPLKCIWCHNPESIDSMPEIALLERKCVKCGECSTSCPLGLHELANDAHTIRRDKCTLCRSCVKACIPEALKFYGTKYTAAELLKIAVSDTDFYKQSGGGVTCSGGEPMLQADFVAAFLSLCKGSGLHTAVDTSGCAQWISFENILSFTDIFLYDIKHMDTSEHKKLTGIGNELILDNLQKLSAHGAAIEIRMPVVPGLNDREQNILQTAEFLKKIKTLTVIRPLPYHALSGSKYSAIGKRHKMPAATGDEYAAAQRVADIFRSEGLPSREPD